MRFSGTAVLRSALSGTHPLRFAVAQSFLQRLRGLMFGPGLADGQALLLRRCASVHTAFMRHAIDVVYLGGDGRVLKCVGHLKPWRASNSGVGLWAARRLGGVHTLELAAGSIERMGLQEGDRFEATPPPFLNTLRARRSQGGAAMVEFILVGPVLTLMGLSLVQYGMFFQAKNMINHASFMAARAGSFANAKVETARQAYIQAMLPLYGGGKDPGSRTQALAAATQDLGNPGHLRVEVLNPTQESFDDWSDPALQSAFKTGAMRVIPNANQAFKLADPATAQQLGSHKGFRVFQGEVVKARSGQSLTDANLLKLRITQAYEPKVPFMKGFITRFMQWMDTKDDAVRTAMLAEGRIPIVSHVTVQMQSAAIESPQQVSSPGEGNHGAPSDPGEPPATADPPPTASDPGGTDDGSGTCSAADCPVCPKTVKQVLNADALFQFDKSSLADMLPGGTAQLDRLIDYARTAQPTRVTIVGYTDPLGTAAHNQKLSEARATTVRDYLQSHGFPKVPIEVIGKADADPMVDAATCARLPKAQQIECLQPDRRVEVLMHGI